MKVTDKGIDYMAALATVGLIVALFATLGMGAVKAICDDPGPQPLTQQQIREILRPGGECFLCHLPG